MEIERKFLVRGLDFKSRAHKSYRIKQGYISSGNGRTVRVRIRDNQGFLTIKGPSLDGGLSRYEFEKEISQEEAEQLFLICEPGVIDKTRYLVCSGRHTFEVDEFYGDNEGLVIAEVELASPDEPSFTNIEAAAGATVQHINTRVNKTNRNACLRNKTTSLASLSIFTYAIPRIF